MASPAKQARDDDADDSDDDGRPAGAPRQAIAAAAAPSVAPVEEKVSALGMSLSNSGLARAGGRAGNSEAAAEAARERERMEALLREVNKAMEVKTFEKDFAYDEDAAELVHYHHPYELAREFATLHQSFGFPCHKRYNMHYLSAGVLLYASGNTVHLLNLNDAIKKPRVLFGHGKVSNAGVAAVAVHPERRHIAVAEKGKDPSIYIYRSTDWRIVRILRKGTERAYSDIQFSHDGKKLASVGSEPDYLLTVWDWENERVILRTKAFSQEVFHVTFSPVNDGRLITSGQGHIRFWKMAGTFTGLKLQGAIGKFGNIELSDISAYAELPDGKVLSGTESGYLLMWDGNFIQFQVAKPGKQPCHQGVIEFIALEDRELITAGEDGYIKRWKFDRLEFAEASDDDPVIQLEPLAEIKVGDNVKIKGMLRGDDHWLIQDANSGIYKLSLSTNEIHKIYEVHSGPVYGLQVAPPECKLHMAITCGRDHSVRCWDLQAGTQVYSRSFNKPARSLLWAPATVDPEYRTVLAGFEDGVVRALRRYADSFKLIQVLKPHKVAVTHIAISPDGRYMASSSIDGVLFFLSISSLGTRFDPIGFIKLKFPPISLGWSTDSAHLLCACGPDVLRFARPEAKYQAQESRDTFNIEADLKWDTYRPVIVEEKKKDDDDITIDEGETKEGTAAATGSGAVEEKKDARPRTPPAPVVPSTPDNISAVLYAATANTFWVTLDGGGSDHHHKLFPGTRYEHLYLCKFGDTKPVKTINIGRDMGTINSLGYSPSGSQLLIGTKNGGIQVRPVAELEYYLYLQAHDGSRGTIHHVATTFDDRFLMSVGKDGNFFVHTLDMNAALKHVDRDLIKRIEFEEARKKEKARKEREEKAKEIAEKKKKEAEDRGDGPPPPTPPPVPKEVKKVEEVKVLVDEPEVTIYGHSLAQPVRINQLPAPIVPAERIDTRIEPDEAVDIVDTKYYSIEEAKQKQEEDERKLSAEAKKERVRDEIKSLRTEFTFLLKKNQSMEKSQQLPREAFELDPKLRRQLEMEAQKKIDEVKSELAWVSEKHSIALAKLKARFLDNLIVEHVTVRSFRTGTSVACFRTQRLPEFLQVAIKQVNRSLAEESAKAEMEAAAAQPQAAQFITGLEDKNGGNGQAGDDTPSTTRSSKSRGGIKSAGGGIGRSRLSTSSRSSALGAAAVPLPQTRATSGLSVLKKAPRFRATGVSEAELRKKARLERQKLLTSLKATKPEKNIDDPADIAALQYAEKNMGDYKLKSDEKYVVPEHQRVNAERKRRQMVMLQASVHSMKMEFNERFLAMRDLKKRIILNIKRDNVRLRELNKKLNIAQDLYEPELDPAEWPEDREKFTKEDLAAFAAQREKERLRQLQAGRSVYADLYDDGSQPTPTKKEDKKDASSSSSASDAKRGITDTRTGVNPSTGTTSDTTDRIGIESYDDRVAAITKSELELAEEAIARKVLEHERRTLLDKIDFAVWTFDQNIAKLRKEKFKMDTDLKTTDLKILTLYQELNLLKDFEENENRLLQKREKFRKQMASVMQEMAETKEKVNQKLNEVNAWKEKDQQVGAEFNLVVGPDKSFQAQLSKIFKKKVKGKKKKAREDVDDDDESGGDDDKYDSDKDALDGDDDSGEDGDDDDSCPAGCDPATYEKVLDLRTKRQEQDEIKEELLKVVAELQKAYERHQGRERNIDRQLTETEVEIEAFQTQKQAALNLIEVTVPLKLSQMKYLVDNKYLPKDISNSLIFTTNGLQRLRKRIAELRDEKSKLHKDYKALTKSHDALMGELNEKRSLIDVEKKKCMDVQMLKFGKTIDLAILEKVGEDESAIELRAKLKEMEDGSVRELTDWDRKIQECKDELAEITRQNTAWLERVAKLTKAQYDLEDQLNTTTKNIHVADSTPVDDKAEAERQQLVTLVQIQEREIDALKAEIHVLRRKGGHVYTPQ